MTRAGVTASILAWIAIAAPGQAQTVRVTGASTVQYVQLRPLLVDSVPVDSTSGVGIIRRASNGLLVRCVTGERFCRGTRPAETSSVAPVIQDITISAWGLGRGIRAQAQLRSRATIGGNDGLWPRADDHLAALSAFIELERSRYRVRAGRQWMISSLGYYNFDGGAARLRIRPDLTLEAFGGWSLERGLDEPATSEALAALEPFAPDKRSLIIGSKLSYRPSVRLAGSIMYQREIRDDRFGLYAERAAADAVYRWTGGSVDATIQGDVAGRNLNLARIAGRISISDRIAGRAAIRAYSPFFELWTIWGAFDPVGFREASIGASIRSSDVIGFDVDLARRQYEDTQASTVFGSYRSSGWTAAASSTWQAAPAWHVRGDYRIEFGFGAARSEAGVHVQREIDAYRTLGVAALAYQRQFEFRVTEGTVYGLAIDGHSRVGGRSRLDASLAYHRHVGLDSEPDADWSQIRGLVRFEWTIGPEPGLVVAAGGGR